MAPRIVDKEAKKNQIIQAALQVFAKNGIAKSKMIDIANAAGMGKGTIYEYFRSKEEIFAEAYNTFFADMKESLITHIAEVDDPVEKLNLLSNLSFSFLDSESRDFAAVMMDFWAEGVRTKNDEMLEIVNLKRTYTEYRTLISQIVREGIQKGIFKKVDVDSYSAILIAALDGILLQTIIDPNIINLVNVEKTLSETLISGLKK